MKKFRNDIILFGNRRAGASFANWSALDKWAFAHRIPEVVLTDIERCGPMVDQLDSGLRAMLVYGGDGTIFRILNALHRSRKLDELIIVPIGGGTMVRLPRFARWRETPVENAQKALTLYDRQYQACLHIPLLSVKWGGREYVAFTFLPGPTAQVMREYSRFKTTPLLAGIFTVINLAAALFNWPKSLVRLYEQFPAVVKINGQQLPRRHFFGVIADTMDTLIFGIAPYRMKRGLNQFNCLCYSADHHTIVRHFPQLVVGRPPRDNRFFNQPASELIIEASSDLFFTLDGEFFEAKKGDTIFVTLGPSVRVLVNPTMTLPRGVRFYSRLDALLTSLNKLTSYVLPDRK